MKKVITILAILVVLTSAVFAAETHIIKIQAEVVEKLPAFQLLLGNNVKTNDAANRLNDDTYDDVVVDYRTDEEATTWDLSRDTKTLTFNGKLANAAKTDLDYTLIFIAGVFTSETVDTKLAPSAATVTKASSADTTNASVASAASELTEAEKTEYGVVGGARAQKINVDFSDDVECVAGNLADFAVTYTADNTLEVADDYEAAIKMIVVAR